MKIHKARNNNKRSIGFLFVLQVVFGTLPAVLLVIFAMNVDDSNMLVGGYISAAAIILCGFAYTIIGRKYNILISGLKGERALYKIAKRFRNRYHIFLNVPIRYKHNRSEIDMLMVSENGILIIEAKNHSGTIFGSEKDEHWTQTKHYRDGKVTESEMRNPLRQLARQRDILKHILRAEGHDVWLDGVVFFSNPFVKLSLNLSGDNTFVVSGEEELIRFIDGYKPSRHLSEEDVNDIVDQLDRLM